MFFSNSLYKIKKIKNRNFIKKREKKKKKKNSAQDIKVVPDTQLL